MKGQRLWGRGRAGQRLWGAKGGEMPMTGWGQGGCRGKT